MPWSHSALKQYETCPRQYHALRILKKYPQEKTEPIMYGEQLHAAAEKYIANDEPLPEQFSFVQPVVDAILSKPGRRFAEYQMALNAELEPVDWFSKKVWVRGVADLLIVDDENKQAWVVDWKTGNNKYPDRDQLVLMSLMTFKYFPEVQQVNSALVFVTRNDMVKHRVMRDDDEMLWWRYRERVARIDASAANEVWNPKQSGLCKRWCPVLECEFNGRS